MIKIKKKVNVNIDHSEPAFFSDTITVSHNPQKFILDFTQTTPRFDLIGNERQQSFTVKHKTIILDPVVAKNFMDILKQNITRFEKNFGKIKVLKMKKRAPKASTAPTESVSYIG